jgi:hypothetical protein
VSVRPQWEWRFEDEAGHAVDRPTSPVFDARYDAEEWLGDRWRALAADGVRVAQLLHEGAAVGPAVPIPEA